MATKQKKQGKQQPAENRGTELFESSEALAQQISKTEAFVKNNSTLVYVVAGVLLLGVAGILFFRYYTDNQNRKAQEEMFQAQFYFERDSLQLALFGDGNNFGFLDIIDLYGGTQAGNLANFYAGTIYLKQGDYSTALDYLEGFSSSDVLVQPRAYALTGDAHMELNSYDDAADYYDKAANSVEDKRFSPRYLMKAGLAYELAGDYEAAIERYSRVIEDFPRSSEDANAKREKARLEGMM
ncbi:MAG TPA: cytochrome C biosynthesis protein [Cytophagales bacterium]|nr:cytochrome C biosynthesis protein [Cytophagales bacterium]HAA21697.1 cytochrome C biosynthesis protein [Cytophagales bacterium]HAP60595.1 cytochrome C biosynthesis protein [Cytophagales bacterium]